MVQLWRWNYVKLTNNITKMDKCETIKTAMKEIEPAEDKYINKINV